jgi:hypothetical protein
MTACERIERAEDIQRRLKKLQEKHCKALTAGDLETPRVHDEVTRLVEQRDRLDHRREAARLAQLAEEPTAS